MTRGRARRFDRTDAVDAYAGGLRMSELGKRYGVSAQAVSLALQKELPGGAHVRLREGLSRAARSRPGVRCRICGDGVIQGQAICRGECRRIWMLLRTHTAGLNDQHRRHVAEYVLRNRERHTAIQVAGAERVLAGAALRRGRWVVPGSATFAAAITCYERGYPFFNELPAPIREQVLREMEAA